VANEPDKSTNPKLICHLRKVGIFSLQCGGGTVSLTQKPKAEIAMPLTFRGISLRPVLEEDLPFLFHLWADPCRCHLWLRGRPVYDEASFYQAWRSMTCGMVAAKFIVESAGQPIGLVFDYDRTPEDGWTKAMTMLQEESVGHGGGVIATALLMDWLFQSLPLRKVYHEVYGYNASVVRIWRKLGLVEEGVLKADRYWNGAYWDLHIFALYREAWPAVRDRVLRLPKAEPEAPAGPVSPGKEVSDPNPDWPAIDCPPGAE
jgi:RimJ/RimL family protein N-acetyltransferase